MGPFFPNGLEVVLGQTIWAAAAVYQLVKGTCEVEVCCFELLEGRDTVGDQDTMVDESSCRL